MRSSLLFRILLTLALLRIPLSVAADDELKYVEINTLGYTLNPTTHEASFDWVASGFQQSQPLNIPSSITSDGETYTVTAIGSRIFSNYKQVPSITLPSTLKKIGDYAFSNCKAITTLAIPDGVTYIGNRAFNSCENLTSLTIPANVTTLGHMACFNMNALQTVTLRCSCDIPSDLFANSSESYNHVRTLIIEGTIETIPVDLMKNATQLEQVVFNENVKVIKNSAFEGCSNLTSILLPPNLTNIELYAFYQCTGLAGKISIPATCVEIGEAAFKGCFSLEEVEINGIQKIGQNAFEGDYSIKKVIINEGTEQINVSAFAGCSGITQLHLPSSLKVLQSNVFQYCTNITYSDFVLPESLTVLGSNCFQGCDRIEKVTIPAACTTMGGSAFKDCKGLKSAEILAAKGKIGAGTFQNCTSLEYVHIGGGVTGILNNPFQGCTSLKTVNITAPLTTIGIQSFSGCSSIEVISFPETLQSLGTSAFQGTSVHEYNLPGAVNSVARMSMDSNPSTIRVARYGVPTATSDIVQNYEECWLYVVSGYEADFAAHPIWSKFTKVGRLPEPTSVLTSDAVELKVGATLQLMCELVPSNTYARLFYKSEDESIVSVNANGVITGVHFGQAVVKITNVDGSELGSVTVDVTDKYDAPVFKLLTWSAASYKKENGNSNSNNVGADKADAAYNFHISNWQEMSQDEIDAFHAAFQSFKKDYTDKYYNVPDGKFIYSVTISNLPKDTYITIDGHANDNKHWGIPSSIVNGKQLASDGSSYFELWDGASGYPIIYNYIDGKDVTIDFYTLTFPNEKSGEYVTGPNQPHDVTLHILDIIPGEQYSVPTYKLLVWDSSTYQAINGNSNSDNASHEAALSYHHFETSEWQPMSAEEISQFKQEYFDFKGTANANKWYNEPDGKFVHSVTYTNVANGTHFTIDGRDNDNKHYGVPSTQQSLKTFETTSATYHELWSGDSGHPVIYNGPDGNDVTVQFSTLTFPSNNSGGFTGEPTQPRYVSFAAYDPTVSSTHDTIFVVTDNSTKDFEGAPIYSVAGQFLGTDPKSLPAGIYIQSTSTTSRKLIIH